MNTLRLPMTDKMNKFMLEVKLQLDQTNLHNPQVFVYLKNLALSYSIDTSELWAIIFLLSTRRPLVIETDETHNEIKIRLANNYDEVQRTVDFFKKINHTLSVAIGCLATYSDIMEKKQPKQSQLDLLEK